MSEESKWANISDADFVSILLKHRHDQSWTVSQMFELERRGFEILDAHPELKSELKTRQEQLISKITKSAEPAVAAIRGMQKNFEILQESFPKLDLPQYPIFNIPTVNIQSITGPVAPDIGDSQFIESADNGSLEKLGVEHLLEQIADATKTTSDRVKQGWAFWLLFSFSAVSAFCSVYVIIFK
jgi:hypothetical protein